MNKQETMQALKIFAVIAACGLLGALVGYTSAYLDDRANDDSRLLDTAVEEIC